MDIHGANYQRPPPDLVEGKEEYISKISKKLSVLSVLILWLSTISISSSLFSA
jgi:hypothetical protein